MFKSLDYVFTENLNGGIDFNLLKNAVKPVITEIKYIDQRYHEENLTKGTKIPPQF